MSFIEIEKISYSYPVYDEDDADNPAEKDKNESRRVKSEDEAGKALKEVSLSIERGEFVCILGRNGSGKSTLARHLNALLLPDEGVVWVDGIKSTDEGRVWEIRQNVGMVFQNPDNQIIASVVEEDVAFGLENLGIPSDQIQMKVKQILEELDMLDHAKRSPNNLSGGQKQRVAIAGILAMEPKCIVLDEATSMLDPKGRDEVMRLALKLNKEKNISIIAITHYMDEALQADRVFVMSRGSLAFEGTPKEVFSQNSRLEEAGLVLPVIVKLADELRNAGVNIPESVLFPGELAEFLKEKLKVSKDGLK